eukprot:9076067-Pyramimonas_sp.AAC.1
MEAERPKEILLVLLLVLLLRLLLLHDVAAIAATSVSRLRQARSAREHCGSACIRAQHAPPADKSEWRLRG